MARPASKRHITNSLGTGRQAMRFHQLRNTTKTVRWVRVLIVCIAAASLICRCETVPAELRHVVILHADQLRADCLACYGNPIVRTPHIDQLAAEGTLFTSAFSQHPQCVPSRSAMFTGRYPHVNGATSNYTAMSSSERTVAEILRDYGYHTAATGKLHIFPEKQELGFAKTVLSGGQRSGATSPDVLGEDYRKWCRENGFWETLKRAYAKRGQPSYLASFQAQPSSMPLRAYVDNWVGDQAVRLIEEQSQDQPLFLFVGFPNPHNPFEPPEPFASLYQPDQMILPPSFHEDLSNKPPIHFAYKRSGRTNDYTKLTSKALRQVIAYYYGSISLVDAQVGKIMDALRDRDLLDDTLVIFTADHGEFLGHHGMLLKGIDQYPMLYDDLIHVPLIVRTPGAAGGRRVQELVELIDVCPTALEWAGMTTPSEVQGHSLLPATLGQDVPKREYIFAESGAVKALRGRRWKMVHYPGQPYGELYDLRDDPLEMNNLYDSGTHTEPRARLTTALLNRLIYTEGPRHGESLRGPAYWRKQYRAPFPSPGKTQR